MSYTPTVWETGDIVTAEKLNKIEGGIAAADGELPAVTSDDNGDVLTVVNGAWAKATPSGGVDIFEVLFDVTYDESTTSYTVSCNHTAAEIQAAASAEKYIVAKAIFYQTWPYYNASAFGVESPNIIQCHFVTADATDSALYISTIVWNTTESKWDFTENGYTLTPAEE